MDDNPFFEKVAPKKRNWFITILQTLVIITSVGIVMYLFILSPNEVDGASMQPNFYTGQLYFANRLVQWFDGTGFGKISGFQYQRGDAVVLQIPNHPQFIKRIIGLGGDKIQLIGGSLYVNDQKIQEDYLAPATFTKGGDFLQDGGEARFVPQGSFFVVGDNRPVSYDSRYLGFIKKEWMKGKVILRFWPLDTFGIIQTGTIKFLGQ